MYRSHVEDPMRMDKSPSRASDTQQALTNVNYLPCLPLIKRLGMKL